MSVLIAGHAVRPLAEAVRERAEQRESFAPSPAPAAD